MAKPIKRRLWADVLGFHLPDAWQPMKAPKETQKSWLGRVEFKQLVLSFLSLAMPVAIVSLQLHFGLYSAPFAGLFLWISLLASVAGEKTAFFTLIPCVAAGNLLMEPIGQFSASLHMLVTSATLLTVGLAIATVITRFRQTLAENIRLVASLECSLQARDDFVAVAGHELKTPFTALWLRVQSWQRRLAKEDTPKASDERKNLAVCVRSLERLGRLIDELLDVSRIAANRVDIVLEAVDIGELVREVVARFSTPARQAGCCLVYESNAKVIALCDRLRTEQVLVNLISNAVRYSDQQPIRIDTKQHASHIEFSVADRGPGVPPEEQEQIFERFARGAGSAGKSAGLGLGLWIVRDLVQRMNGTVKVHSKQGFGAEFSVCLPKFSS